MIIAIDGTAASGKSTTARIVASKFGIMYLDTGAMYRAVTLAVLGQSIELGDKKALSSLLKTLDLEVKLGNNCTEIFLKGINVSNKIRSVEVTENVSAVSSIPRVRSAMVAIQRVLGNKADCVVEGRDIGTVVFPKARFKFFMTADVNIRAKRRQSDLLQLGERRSLRDLVRDLYARDQKDSSRFQSPLTKAVDAVEIDTTHFSINEQVGIIVDYVNLRIE